LNKEFEYEEEGQVVGTLLNYSIGFGLVIVIVIFMVVLGAKVFESQQTVISGLANPDGNVLTNDALVGGVEVAGDVNESIQGAFSSMTTFTSNLDIIAIAVVFGISLVVILGAFSGIGFGGISGGSQGGGKYSAI